ncbi:MAG: bifunctional 5,10-methylenetetrahydrofolate dehydrogenase/5,10-methenyltetrahydrofolate cyclohydrolase [Xanthomonadaceae bacterium]|nr:bifunctional 5,10-methylenetetrahydrofolate dehydrogenase/5,10-methenyltetrahydrofolate cyclohydrolase [Xanthomonadaceae bacterium]
MAAKILYSKPLIDNSISEFKKRVAAIVQKRGSPPKLAVVLVGEDPASVIYTSNKGKAAVAIGMKHQTVKLLASISPEAAFLEIKKLNEDPSVDGILIQRPLPKSFKEEELIYWIAPKKDVDCFHPENLGRLVLGFSGPKSCTPDGVMRLLAHYGISPAGKTACIIGRSAIVGKPMTSLLLNANATVIQCHSQTKNLESYTKTADILIVAAGKPHLVRAEHIKPGAVVIDVGIHRDAAGKIVGDVHAESATNVASALSPVPGGVGPMTINSLILNTIVAAENGL